MKKNDEYIKKQFDRVLHFLNDAVINEAYINDFESQILKFNHQASVREKRISLKWIKRGLKRLIRDQYRSEYKNTDFVDCISDNIYPEIRLTFHKNLILAPTLLSWESEFSTYFKNKIAYIIFKRLETKSIYHLRVCEHCEKIYLADRLNNPRKYCTKDCGHAYWLKEMDKTSNNK